MRFVDLRTPRARRQFINQKGRFPRRDPWSPVPEGAGGPQLRETPFAWTRCRTPHPATAGGRSGCAATDAAAGGGSPPSRRPLRALGGNKVHLCRRTGPCACATAHSYWPPGARPAGAPRCLWAAVHAWARRGPEEGGAAHRPAEPTFLAHRVRPKVKPNPHWRLPGRDASPTTTVACGLRFLGSRQGGKRTSRSAGCGRASASSRTEGSGSAGLPLIPPPTLAVPRPPSR